MNSNTEYRIPYLANNPYIYGDIQKNSIMIKPDEGRNNEIHQFGTLISSIKYPTPCEKESITSYPEIHIYESNELREKSQESYTYKSSTENSSGYGEIYEKNNQFLHPNDSYQRKNNEISPNKEQYTPGKLSQELRYQENIIKHQENTPKSMIYQEHKSYNPIRHQENTTKYQENTPNSMIYQENKSNNSIRYQENTVKCQENAPDSMIYQENKSNNPIRYQERISNNPIRFQENSSNDSRINQENAPSLSIKYQENALINPIKYPIFIEKNESNLYNHNQLEDKLKKNETFSYNQNQYEEKTKKNYLILNNYNQNEEKWKNSEHNYKYLKEKDQYYSDHSKKIDYSYTRDELESSAYPDSVLSEKKMNYSSKISEKSDQNIYQPRRDYRKIDFKEAYDENSRCMSSKKYEKRYDTTENSYRADKLEKNIEYSYKKENFDRSDTFSSSNPKENSDKNIRPSRDIWIQQSENTKKLIKDKPMLDVSKLDRSIRSSSNNSKTKKKNISKSTSKKSKENRSASIRERNFKDKEVFVTVMMNVLKNHSKYCSSLRREINAIKAKNVYEI